MDWKTILVHCNDHRRVYTLLTSAAALAERYNSHLIGLSVVPPVLIASAGSVEAPPVLIDAHCELYREQIPQLRRAFEEMTRGKSFSTEWRDGDAGAFNVADVVLGHGRAADLIIASHDDPEWAGSETLDVPERLVMESGRPVLVVPNDHAGSRIGTRILVAWSGQRESARAVFDALPVLKTSEEVRIVRVAQSTAEDVLARTSDIAGTLSRHGVNCDRTHIIALYTGVGETLEASARDFGADLVVMGCYGHSRLREFILGGASRYFLGEAEIPVLMSH
ncbi:MAG: universal stress protein [Hyphomicrobiaceae bacterium]